MAEAFPVKMHLFWGMPIRGIAILPWPFAWGYPLPVAISASLEIGAGIAHPAFQAVLAKAAHPGRRAESMGDFRLWKDFGQAVGVVCPGPAAGLFGIVSALLAIDAVVIRPSPSVKPTMPDGLDPRQCAKQNPFDHRPQNPIKMKKSRSILTLALAFGFLASVAFTSCGTKKEETEDTMEYIDSEHPAEEVHPTDADSTEPPTEGDSIQ